jgi:hypothetical protein
MRISELATGNDGGYGYGHDRDLGSTLGNGEWDLRSSIQSILAGTRWAEVA